MRFIGFAAAAVGLAGLFGAAQAQAHSCNGVKAAHCACSATLGLGGALLSTRTNHAACYNQQANTLPLGNCAQWCGTQLMYLQPESDSALQAAGICGAQTVVFKFSAGTNLPTPWNTQSRFGCVAPTGGSSGSGTGTGVGTGTGNPTGVLPGTGRARAATPQAKKN